MTYRYATEVADATDLAAGRVLYARPGVPALPVRLADELFQRSAAHLDALRAGRRLTLYDPCCGGAYHLAVLGLLHADRLHAVIASDADAEVLSLAARNLSLLAPTGLARRAEELAALHAAHGKASHAQAQVSCARLHAALVQRLGERRIETRIFTANARNAPDLACGLGEALVDMVIADVPYGRLSAWAAPSAGVEAQAADAADGAPLTAMLAALRAVLLPGAVVGIVADKAQKPRHPAYARVEQFQVGKRRCTILRVAS